MSSWVNRLIVALCVQVLVAGVAIDLGAKWARQELATTCLPQADERLQATIQNTDGVTCIYAQTYARSKRVRRAT